MKKILNPIFFTLSVVFLMLSIFSCEKVIKLDLNSESPKIIIEAPINLDSTNQKITIKQTVNFDDENSGIAVTTADVTISNGTTSIKFNHISNGEYVASTPLSFFGSDKSYELKVIHEGKTYISTSTCPKYPTPLDSIGVYKQKTFGRYNYSIVPLKNESTNLVENWYQFIAYKNNQKINKIIIDDDQNLNGVKVTRKPIFGLNEFSPDTIINNQPKYKIKSENGNIDIVNSVDIKLVMVNIEYKIYRYFFTLNSNQGSATPTNPDPLFTNGALGYFSVQKSYTLPPKTISAD